MPLHVPPFSLRALRAHVFRWPVKTPVRTSFGTMFDRPMVLVEAEDASGERGWGEIWCNFPSVGAEHRARLVESLFAPMLVAPGLEGAQIDSPASTFAELTAKTAVLAIQAGEPGPIMQCIAGIDTALWDLAARLARQPLWKFLGGTSPSVKVYASGINPDGAVELASMRRAQGYGAFKLKVGFGLDRDLANLRDLRKALGDATPLMVDANQGWTMQQALEAVPHLEEFRLRWLEEPVRADTPWPEWQRLAKASRVPLAGGENIAGFAAFEDALAAKVFATVQPDMAKWGGFTGCVPVARRIRASGATFCPHYLGGGIGLLASAHLLAAVGGDGMLEVDANENPLRTESCGALSTVQAGHATLDDSPGLGFTPDLEQLHALCSK